ncbi:MAG: hypothetical protein ACI9LM_003741 [Alteromonadaceae bacterium]|jgi:hypothetical protein
MPKLDVNSDQLHFKQLSWYWQEDSHKKISHTANQNIQLNLPQSSSSALNTSELDSLKLSASDLNSSQLSSPLPNALKNENTKSKTCLEQTTDAPASTGNTVDISQIQTKLTSIIQQPGVAELSASYYKKALQQREKIINHLAKHRQQVMQLVEVKESAEFSKLADCHDPQTKKLLAILQCK